MSTDAIKCRHPRVSVIISTTGRRESLFSAIDSISSQHCTECELLVVLSGTNIHISTDALRQWPVRVLHESRRGVSIARNRALQDATGEILVCVDDDIVAGENWLHNLLTEFDDPEVVCATGRVIPEGTGYFLARRYETARSLSRWVQHGRDGDWLGVALSFDTGIGCNMAFRRSFLLRTGFPEDLGAGCALASCDEPYLFFEVLSQGHSLAHTPDAVVTHCFDEDKANLHSRVFELLQGCCAFRLKLLLEKKGFRRDITANILRSVYAAVVGTRTIPITSEISWTRTLVALLGGPILLLRSKFARRH